MKKRFISILAAAIIAVHIGYLFFKVSAGSTEGAWEVPSILYGRPMEVRPGDHLDNLQFENRLQRLAYKPASEKTLTAGTYCKDSSKIRVWVRGGGSRDHAVTKGPVEIALKDRRVTSLTRPDGDPMNVVRFEPEEIGRIMGPKMESRSPVPLSAISPNLQKAVVASEDGRFYSHIGIDLSSIARALYANFKQRRFAQGGSTITQQLAKNFYLSQKKTLWRKFVEAELAIMLEMRYSKKKILEMYLNKIYFGQDGYRGIYGVEEAAAFYFSKKAIDISLEEAALLAGIIRCPNRYSLLRDPKPAKERRNSVLKRMRKLNFIDDREYATAANSPLTLRMRSMPMRPASYFMDYIQRLTEEEFGSEKLYRTGYRYYTTLDPRQQAAAEEAVRSGLEAIEKTATPAGEPLQAALVAIDTTTGALTAMVGGRDYGQTQFNRAVDAMRQPGSAFKPFILLAAIKQSIEGKKDTTLSTLVATDPMSLQTAEGLWTPSNYDGKSYGKITLRKCIENSVNTAAVRLAFELGLPAVIETARSAGITSPLSPAPSMALGSYEVTPMELAYAYATIASGGIRYAPFPLSSVTTADGERIVNKSAVGKQAVDPRAAYITAYALQGVLDRGTARSAKTLGGIYFPAAGKTGTTDGNRDSWFVGFTSGVVCAVWVGYDSGGDTKLSGAEGALRIWTRFMRAVYPKMGPLPMKMPEGVEIAVIDPETGYRATSACPQTLQEAYIKGTAPTQTCPLHPVNPVIDVVQRGAKTIGDFFRGLFK